MSHTRRKYDPEFRAGAVRIVRETRRPVVEIARDLGIGAGTLGNWVRKDRIERVGAHNSVVGADQGFRAPSGDQESVRDSVHEDSASAPIAAGQRARQSFRHPYPPAGLWRLGGFLRTGASAGTGPRIRLSGS